MPVQVGLDRGNVADWQVDIVQVVTSGEALGHGHDHVGLLQHLGCHHVVLRAQRYPALDAHLAERQIHMAQAAAAAGDMDMRLAQVIVEGQRGLVCQWMPLAHTTHIAVLHQLHMAHLRVSVERRVHSEVEASGGQFLGGFPALGKKAFDGHRRRQASQSLEQRWQDHCLGQVGHADAVILVGLQRVEDATFLHRYPEQRKGVAHRADDVLRHRCRHHALCRAHEQRVVEGLTQPCQCVGDRRLGNADNLSGAGQVGFGVDGVEDNEKVEIDLVQVH